MKLNPPDSSSDLEVAREIARRLHQRRRREDRVSSDAEPVPPLAAMPPLAATAPPRPARVVPPPPPLRPAPPPTPAPPPPTPSPDARPAALTVEEPHPAPSWDAPAAPPEDDPLAGFGGPAPDVSEPEIDASGAETEVEPPPEDGDSDAGFEPGEPEVEVEDLPSYPEEEPVSPEEMVGTPEPGPFEDLPVPGDDTSSPFDEPLDDTSEEESISVEEPRSWDDVVEACLVLAHAQGAMLVDPAGQVFAFRGEWPRPGPEAIAAKLVATMERTLKDAPTRSISAPLMGLHLTAWRVPLAEGLVTAAFIGDTPVRAESRPAIDSEIHRGAGA